MILNTERIYVKVYNQMRKFAWKSSWQKYKYNQYKYNIIEYKNIKEGITGVLWGNLSNCTYLGKGNFFLWTTFPSPGQNMG